ncbi:MAG TPA: hypothetical protein DHW46_07255, partial [Halomonas sp.]|nr:hypothetical protein [Halomonas sp.]HCL23414.1 hypothetical protein [Halomonas sp.]
MTQIATTLPDVLVGPLLRRLSPSRLILWLVATRPLTMLLVLNPEQEEQQTHALDNAHQRVAIGRHAYIHCIDLSLPTALPTDTRIAYDLQVQSTDGAWQPLPEWAPWLCHDDYDYPGFVLASRHHRLMHGSCRKPHHDSADGLVRADNWIAER